MRQRFVNLRIPETVEIVVEDGRFAAIEPAVPQCPSTTSLVAPSSATTQAAAATLLGAFARSAV